MNEDLKNKLAKIYELINRGATEGERISAKKALDRIIEKYKIDESQLNEIVLKRYVFKYSTDIERTLLCAIMRMFTPASYNELRQGVKYLSCRMVYLDWITIESVYEYFRRHMKNQWKLLCADQLKKCRKASSKNKKRKYLQELFLTEYLIKSKLVKDGDIKIVEVTSAKEIHDRMQLLNIEGGAYNKQVISNYLLEN